MDTHFVSTKHVKGMAFSADVNGHTVLMDSSDDGVQQGASPKRLLLAGLAGCTGIDVVSILEKMKVPFSDFSIDIDASLTEEHPKTYNKVGIVYKIKLADEDRVKMKKAVALSQEKYCGVSAMFQAFSTIESEIVYL